MSHLEKGLEWLRPLILNSNTWDFCVVWKLGDDPSRFIEWVGCCCNGSGHEEISKKKIKKEENYSSICKDVNFVHLANTKSCQLLSNLPSFMSLYSGVHGEVVISCQSRWISLASTRDSELSDEDFEGTRVLIPVFGGLVELFSTENISENESVIEYVKAQFNNLEPETISNSTVSFDESNIDPLLEKNSDASFSSLLQFSIMPPVTQTPGDSAKNGSSTGSFPSDEGPSHESIPFSVPDIKPFAVTDGDDGREKGEKKQCKSKNLLTERRRRKRINDGMLMLRSLVPKITKMHKAATLSDAVDYVKELQNEARNLLAELDDSNQSNENVYDFKASCMTEQAVEPRILKQLPSSLTKYPKSEVQVEVNQLGVGNYLIRIVCQQNPGVFTMLLEALCSLDMLVLDVNSTVCNSTMSSNFVVQANNTVVNEKELRDLLMLRAV